MKYFVVCIKLPLQKQSCPWARQEAMWRIKGTALDIRKLDNEWGWVISLTLKPLYLREIGHRNQLHRKIGKPRAGLEVSGKGKPSCPARKRTAISRTSRPFTVKSV